MPYAHAAWVQERVALAPRRPLAGEDNSRPSERVLQLWQTASAVCFDVDCELLPVAVWAGLHAAAAAQPGWRVACTAPINMLAQHLLGACAEGSGMQRPQDRGRFAMALDAHFDMTVGENHVAPLCHHAGTVANNDQLDLLAEWMGVGQQVAALTNSVRTAGNAW